MKTTTFKIKYCCDERFKKLYSPLMKSFKKQYGKKLFDTFEISLTETKKDATIYLLNPRPPAADACPKCYTHWKLQREKNREWLKSNKTVTVYEATIEVKHGRD